MHNLTDPDLSYEVRNTATGALLVWAQCVEPGRYEVRNADGRAETHPDRWSALVALARLAADGTAASGPTPADLASAVARMADRYSDAAADLAVAIVRGQPAEAHEKTADRRRAALARLVAALAAGGAR